ncbi:FAM91, N-terminal domain-containing protein, partial [Haematococcus lacustris]
MDSLLRSALQRGKAYEDLPLRLQQSISLGEYQSAVQHFWIQQGEDWGVSPACSACGEQEYYEELIRSYKAWMRLFPYHLSGYVCRVMRLTPAKYYHDMLVAALTQEKPYHQIPNFTAADALRLLGVGRNEYIATLNACKGRRLLWRVNRSSVARDMLPYAPKDHRIEPWWTVSVVNIGESEYRELDAEEVAHLKTASGPGPEHVTCCADLRPAVLRSLLRKGLVYVEVPVALSHRFSIPPLDGFVSNKDAAAGLGGGGGAAPASAAADPVEGLLYAVFVANSERLTVADLASMLAVRPDAVCAALALASRLGFATRVHPPVDPRQAAYLNPGSAADMGRGSSSSLGTPGQADLLGLEQGGPGGG